MNDGNDKGQADGLGLVKRDVDGPAFHGPANRHVDGPAFHGPANCNVLSAQLWRDIPLLKTLLGEVLSVTVF